MRAADRQRTGGAGQTISSTPRELRARARAIYISPRIYQDNFPLASSARRRALYERARAQVRGVDARLNERPTHLWALCATALPRGARIPTRLTAASCFRNASPPFREPDPRTSACAHNRAAERADFLSPSRSPASLYLSSAPFFSFYSPRWRAGNSHSFLQPVSFTGLGLGRGIQLTGIETALFLPPPMPCGPAQKFEEYR